MTSGGCSKITILKIPPSRRREGRRERKRKRAEKKTSLETGEAEKRVGTRPCYQKLMRKTESIDRKCSYVPSSAAGWLCLSFHNFTFFHISNKTRVCGESDLKAKNEVGKS